MMSEPGMKSHAVVIEGWSPLLVLAAAPAIRRSEAVYIARRAPLREPSARRRSLVRTAIGWLNPRARIIVVPLETISDQIWIANRDAVDEAATLEPRIRQAGAYRLLRGLVGDDLVVRYFQAALVSRLPTPQLLDVQVRHVAAMHDAVTVVRTWETRLARDTVDRAPIGILHRLAGFLAASGARLFLVAVPLAFIARRIIYGIRLARPRSYLAAVPVVWGVPSESLSKTEMRRPQDDLYVYGGQFEPGRLVHIFGDWQFDAATRAGYQEEFARRTLPTADKNRFGLNLSTLLLAICATGTLAWFAITPRRSAWLDALLLQETPKAVYYWLAKHVEFGHLRYKVEVVKNDYNPAHVINTIVGRQYGVVSVGIQHAGSPYDAPQLAFVCFDQYVVFGDLYVRAFGDRWADVPLARTGRESVDWVAEAVEPARLSELQRRWDGKHDGRGPIVLVCFPGAAEICLRGQWDQIYEGLESLAAQPGDFTVVLRFRNAASMRVPHVGRFARLPERDRRFVVELADFTTYELIALSQVVIACEASFTVNEAIATVPAVFTFEYVGTARHYFRPYGTDLVLRTAADVRRVFAAMKTGFEGFDCRWEALRRDANFHTDGRNRQRLRELIEHAAMPSGGSTPGPAGAVAESELRS